MALFILANFSQKIIHSKTGHTFLLYSSVDGDSCTFDLKLAESEADGAEPLDPRHLGRWWSATWSADALSEIGSVDSIASNLEKGELQVRGWSKGKMEREDLELKLLVGTDDSRMTLVFPQCSAEGAIGRQTSLLSGIADQAHLCQHRIFPSDPSWREKKMRADLAECNRLLLKRDHTIDDLQAQLEAANDQLKIYIRDAAPSRPVNVHRKIPKGNSKVCVTKKRRLVQKIEYED